MSFGGIHFYGFATEWWYSVEESNKKISTLDRLMTFGQKPMTGKNTDNPNVSTWIDADILPRRNKRSIHCSQHGVRLRAKCSVVFGVQIMSHSQRMKNEKWIASLPSIFPLFASIFLGADVSLLHTSHISSSTCWLTEKKLSQANVVGGVISIFHCVKTYDTTVIHSIAVIAVV